MRHDLSIVIPAYNEQNRIEATLVDIDTFLSSSSLDYEIVVVDDGSTDKTVALVREIMTRMPALRVIPTSPNRGKGHAVRVGMLGARGAIRLMSDADGSMPATEIPKLVLPILTGRTDVAIGSRYADGASCESSQPKWRVAWSRLCNKFIQKTIVDGIRDTQCGFKAFTAAAAEDVFSRATIDGWAFDLEALALADRLGFDILECAVHWDDDPRSRVNPVKDFIKVLREWMTIRKNLRRGVYGLTARPRRIASGRGQTSAQAA